MQLRHACGDAARLQAGDAMLCYRQTGYVLRSSGLPWFEYGSRSQILHQNHFVWLAAVEQDKIDRATQ
jgi:hypothetical protein